MKTIEQILKELGTDDIDKAMDMVQLYGDTYYRLLDKKIGAVTQGTPEWNEWMAKKKEEEREIKELNNYKNKLILMEKEIIIKKVKNGYVLSFGSYGESHSLICQTPEEVLKELAEFYEEFKKAITK